MLFKYILVSLAISEVFSVVQSRTPEDVIDDFEERFEELHDIFYDWEDIASSTVVPLFNNITLTILDQAKELNDILKNIKIRIEQKSQEILYSADIADNDFVKHCIKQANNKENSLVITALAGQKICIKTAKSYINNVLDYFETVLGQIKADHNILDEIRQDCGTKSDPFDVQACLINELHTSVDSYVKHTEEELKIKLGSIEDEVSFILDQLHECDEYIKDGIIEELSDILHHFKTCVSVDKTSY